MRQMMFVIVLTEQKPRCLFLFSINKGLLETEVF